VCVCVCKRACVRSCARGVDSGARCEDSVFVRGLCGRVCVCMCVCVVCVRVRACAPGPRPPPAKPAPSPLHFPQPASPHARYPHLVPCPARLLPLPAGPGGVREAVPRARTAHDSGPSRRPHRRWCERVPTARSPGHAPVPVAVQGAGGPSAQRHRAGRTEHVLGLRGVQPGCVSAVACGRPFARAGAVPARGCECM
jgi:hypothetical protein